MHVKINFLGPLRDQLGQPSLTVELPQGATYRDLLDAIAPTVSKSTEWDQTTRTFSRRLTVTRNNGSYLRDESTLLADGDEILVLLPMAGG